MPFVWGKWLGTFRAVPALSVLPLFIALAGVLQTGQWLPALLLLAMILAFGAALASFGFKTGIMSVEYAVHYGRGPKRRR